MTAFQNPLSIASSYIHILLLYYSINLFILITMPYPDYITRENFHRSFDLIEILQNSVFYPSSALDGTAIKLLTNQYFSFVHVDYETSEVDVREAMMNDFESHGYDLIEIKNIPLKEIAPKGLNPEIFLPNATEHEKQRINDFSDLFYYRKIKPFAIWAVYEFNPARNSNPNYSPRFSLLHIGAEACITLKNVYEANGINPEIVVIINSGEGYGQNWTQFSNPDYRFHQTLLNNANINHVPMPQKVITNWNNFRWPGYQLEKTVRVPSRIHQYPHDRFHIYKRS